MVQHEPWRGPKYRTGGIDGQRICIVGYSHWLAKGEKDSRDLTKRVISGMIDGSCDFKFFYQIRSYFGLEDNAFWNHVMFFNFLSECVGNAPADLNLVWAAESPQKRLSRAPKLIQSPARESTVALGSQWENSHQQRDTATARRSPTRPPPTVGVDATGLTSTVPFLPTKLSMPHAATSTASRSDTLIFVRELSNHASTPRLPSVFTG